MLKVGVLCFLLTLTVAQDPEPHQLSYCVNHGGFSEYPMRDPHICNCDKPCVKGQPEDRACKVWCRPDHCHCLAECDDQPPYDQQ